MPGDKNTDSNSRFSALPLTLSLETLGGISSAMVLRGTPLPARRSVTFSTSADSQESVDIRILMGESPLAKQNLLVSRFSMTGIPKMERGRPQIVVTFDVDEHCAVKASATMKGSSQNITTQAESAHVDLSAKNIERMLDAAEQARAEDETQIRQIETRNRANAVIRKAEALLQHQPLGPTTERDAIAKALADLGLALDTDNTEVIRATVEEIESLISRQSQSNPFDFQGTSAFSDMFSSFFQAAPASPKPTTSPRTSTRAAPKTAAPKADPKPSPPKATASSRNRIGRVFGGGDFTPEPNLCFTIMPFGEDLQPVYDDHIRPVIESEGLYCLRADDISSTNTITWDIWEKINRARVIVADLTGKNANVFYEVGLAHALGKDVVLITQSMQDVPFDLKGLRCIVYSFTPRGAVKLVDSLRNTIREIMKSA